MIILYNESISQNWHQMYHCIYKWQSNLSMHISIHQMIITLILICIYLDIKDIKDIKNWKSLDIHAKSWVVDRDCTQQGCEDHVHGKREESVGCYFHLLWWLQYFWRFVTLTFIIATYVTVCITKSEVACFD